MKSFITSVANLNEIQLNSFCWFIEYELANEINSVSSILDFNPTREIRIYGYEQIFIFPDYTPTQCKKYALTYSVKLYVPVEVITYSEITNMLGYFGEIPFMLEGGTFILNGNEQVIINQLIKSSGVYYKRELIEDSFFIYSAVIISNRGSCFQFQLDFENVIWVRLNKEDFINIYDFFKEIGLNLSKIIFDFKLPKLLFSFESDTVFKNKHYAELNLPLYKSFTKIYQKKNALLKKKIIGTYEKFNSCSLIFDLNTFNLKQIGRLNLNYKLNLNISTLIHNLTVEDIVAILDYLINLKSGSGVTDDIDHLKNKRVRSIGEILQIQFRIGLIRLTKEIREDEKEEEEETKEKKKKLKKKYNSVGIFSVLQKKFYINPRPIIASLQEFFGSSQLSQFMDQTNPLSGLTHKRRLSLLGPGGLNKDQISFKVRDIHSSHYGRICPIETPEGKSAGLVASLTSYSRINSLGYIETPFFRIHNTFIYNQSLPIYLTSGEENFVYIAPGDISITKKNRIKELFAFIRYNYNFSIISSNKIKLTMISPIQIISVATALIPFMEHDDANRALMGSNMQRQAVPLLFPKKPIVGTGIEHQLALNSGVVVLSKTKGIVQFVSSKKICIRNTETNLLNYILEKYIRLNQSTCFNQKPIVWPGELVFSGQIIGDGPAINDGELSLGQNLLVAYMSWDGYNYEDAIVISERLIFEDIFTSISISKYDINIDDTHNKIEQISRNLPNTDITLLKNLDESGVIKKGTYVKTNDILVGKITPNDTENISPENLLLNALFGVKEPDKFINTSFLVPHGNSGRVIDIRQFKREKHVVIINKSLEQTVVLKKISLIRIFIAQIRKIQIGDKLSGRHGNKGIISRILARTDMPYLLDGTSVDIILNPLGIPSRMNVGQILETLIGLAGDKLNKRFKILPFDEMYNLDTSRNLINCKLNEAAKKTNTPWLFNKQTPGRMPLIDGRTGHFFDNYILVGKSYILKLVHQVDDKIHARSTGPYSLITQQPLRGKSRLGGQRFGEMEVWALEAFGSAYTLQEILTLKSDNVDGREELFDILINGCSSLPKPTVPEAFKVLLNTLRGLGLDISLYKVQNCRKNPNNELTSLILDN